MTTPPAPLPISVFIIAKDEADRIGTAIESIRDLVAEIIVLDSGSSDDTTAVAEAAGAKVSFRAWQGYGPQKRAAEDLCTHDWVLNLDADERATPQLVAEIRGLFASGGIGAADFWRVRILDEFPHETQPARWAYGYNQIRLYRPSIGRFSASTVHDTVRPPEGARVAQLGASMAHRSFRDFSHAVEKLNRYSDMQASDAKGRRISALRLVMEFPLSFLKGYLLRRYALYGAFGFTLAMVHAFGRFIRVAKMRAGQKKG